jgi:riboflavin biosynthesis pyrimidine reductase
VPAGAPAPGREAAAAGGAAAIQPARPAGEPDRRPLLPVVDSRGQVKGWGTLLASGYWRAGVALCSGAIPAGHLAWLEDHGVQRIVTGADRIDLAPALEELAASFGVKTVRVDSGGKLNGELLRLGLVDEISLLMHPFLVGGTSPASMFRASDLVREVGGAAARVAVVPEGEAGHRLAALRRSDVARLAGVRLLSVAAQGLRWRGLSVADRRRIRGRRPARPRCSKAACPPGCCGSCRR